ncbi:MAG: alpha/beta hydrolase [Marichromatium sp.]|nr:alpha/beta hydrolase [Marichromatium sp.]
MDPIAPTDPAADTARFIDCNGFRLHYRRLGDGPRLLLLLHGSFLSLRSWRAVMAPLAEAGYTVVAFDRPAFGASSKPLPGADGQPGYSAHDQSALIAALIPALGFERAVLVGNSTGGTLALMTALEHPERVEALALVDAMILSGYATSEIPGFVKPLMRALTPFFSWLMGRLIARLYDKAIRAFWYRPERLDPEVLAAFRADMMQGPWPRAFWELFLATRRLGLEPRLAGVTPPTLVVTGAHDQTVKVAESERIAAAIPGARLEVIADSGHLPHEESPQAFVATLTDFLQTLPEH